MESFPALIVTGLLSQQFFIRRGRHVVHTWLEKRLDESNEDLDNMSRNSPLWQHKVEIMQSIPGVGRMTATTFLADLPEIGTLSRREINSLVGVSRYSRDSGSFRGRRTTCE